MSNYDFENEEIELQEEEQKANYIIKEGTSKLQFIQQIYA